MPRNRKPESLEPGLFNSETGRSWEPGEWKAYVKRVKEEQLQAEMKRRFRKKKEAARSGLGGVMT